MLLSDLSAKWRAVCQGPDSRQKKLGHSNFQIRTERTELGQYRSVLPHRAARLWRSGSLWLELLEGSFKLIYKDKPDKEARVRSNDPLMESALKKD
jgi:hypothetical protein